jgi:gluconolactonase
MGSAERPPGESAQLAAPNDICFGPDGRLYFTDPVSERAFYEPVPGNVYAYDLQAGELETIASGLLFPNGIAFGPDARALYVAETALSRVLRMPVDGQTIGEPVAFAELDGKPDGMAFDETGRLWACLPSRDQIAIIDVDGHSTGSLELAPGSTPTNCCFGGPNMATLYVTAAGAGAVVAGETTTRGLRLL